MWLAWNREAVDFQSAIPGDNPPRSNYNIVGFGTMMKVRCVISFPGERGGGGAGELVRFE
jgi:hypothetical protein